VENCKPIDISGPDCNLDEIRSALASYTSSAESLAHDSEREIAADLADLTDAVEYRPDRGDYARTHYDQMLDLHFGLAHLVTAKPELRDDAWALIMPARGST
jgi:hypothetical protein